MQQQSISRPPMPALWSVAATSRRDTRFRVMKADLRGRLVQILWNQVIYQTVLFGKIMQAVFFGPLRLIEIEVSWPSLEVLGEGGADVYNCTALARAWVVRSNGNIAGFDHLQGRVRVVFCHALRLAAIPEGVPLAGLGPGRDGRLKDQQ